MQEGYCWSGDFGIDQYVSWNITNEELTLDVIWANLRSFASPNLMRSEKDLTYSQALDKIKDHPMNGTM